MKQNENIQERQVLIVTGLSGAGKTSVMRTLEDIGFYCVDNLPVPLIKSFLKLAFQTHQSLVHIALGIDARDEQFLTQLICEVELLRHQESLAGLKIVFLNASEATLLKRFQETRRSHPLARGIDMISAIRKEKELLEPIQSIASIVLDTDTFTIHEIRDWVRKTFSEQQERRLIVNLVSFGFKYGVPPESNLVYDLRFLPNPFFIAELKHLTGKHEAVYEYLFKQETTQEYWNRLYDFLSYSLKKFYEEGRFFASVAIGCTGGKHRSVAFVEKIAAQKWDHCSLLVHHRDLGRE
jgi:UPF0042 nucleotide-binding protein